MADTNQVGGDFRHQLATFDNSEIGYWLVWKLWLDPASGDHQTGFIDLRVLTDCATNNVWRN